MGRNLSIYYDITRTPEGGWEGDGNSIHVSVDKGGRMFMRRAIVHIGTPEAHEVCWLVAELAGVRAYIVRSSEGEFEVCLTKEDLTP